jgi:hypothetical protein
MKKLSENDRKKFENLVAGGEKTDTELQWMLNDLKWECVNDWKRGNPDRPSAVFSAAYWFDYWVCCDGMLYPIQRWDMKLAQAAIDAFQHLGLKRCVAVLKKLQALVTKATKRHSLQELTKRPFSVEGKRFLRQLERIEAAYHDTRDDTMSKAFVDWVLNHPKAFFK